MFNYEKTLYEKAHKKVCIICPKHGEFWQTPHNHLKGYGCSKCSTEKISKDKILTTEEFIEKAKKIHNNKYNYSKVKYEGSFNYIKIICPKHGEWGSLAYIHLQGCGCPICKTSKPQKEISVFLKKNNQKIIENTRKIIPPLELDIYIPDKNIAIEFNGLYWHSESKLKETNRNPSLYHLNKTKLCEKKGIKLIHIFENEWINKKEIVKSIIKSKLNIYEKKIGARKCKIKEINSKEANSFLKENHLQKNFYNKSINIALFFENKIVSIGCFGKPRYNKNYDYELLRFCNKINTSIIGGFSKILSFFIKKINPINIISYADKRFSFENNVYKKNNFKYKGFTKPNYFYFKDNKNLYSRINFQKHKLKNKLEIYDENKTESENMIINGFNRIFDCGNNIWELNINEVRKYNDILFEEIAK